MMILIFIIYLILPAALSRGVYSASNKNEYQKHKNNASGVLSRGRRLRLTNLPPPLSQLTRQCGILNISQPYRPPRPATMALLIFSSDSHCHCSSFTFLSFIQSLQGVGWSNRYSVWCACYTCNSRQLWNREVTLFAWKICQVAQAYEFNDKSKNIL
jgi:hypothetical protein